MQHGAKPANVARFRAVCEFGNGIRHFGKRLELCIDVRFLLCQNRGGISRNASVEKEEMIFEREAGSEIDQYRLHVNRFVRIELQNIETAEGSRILILFPYRLSDKLYLEPARRFRRLPITHMES